VCAVHESNRAESVMPGSSSGRTLDFESRYGRSNRSPAASLKRREFTEEIFEEW
jgi:hypothetical protein